MIFELFEEFKKKNAIDGKNTHIQKKKRKIMQSCILPIYIGMHGSCIYCIEKFGTCDYIWYIKIFTGPAGP